MGDEKGGEKGKKFGGTGGKDRIQIADTKLKLLDLKPKKKKYIVLQSNLKIFITSIHMNSRKVLKEGMRVICCIYRMTKVNIQRRRLCS